MAQPTITYDLSAAQDAGLSAFTVHHPEFAEHYKRMVEHPRSSLVPLEGMYPFVLILRNDSGELRGYISVRYTYIFLDGSVHHGTEVIEPNLFLGPLVKPGDVYLISQASTVISAGVSRTDPKTVAQYRQLLANCRSVSISLDAVQLSDHIIVGPDEGGLKIRVAAEQRAFSELRNSSHARTYLESVRRTPPGAPFNVELGNAQADYWYTEARRKIASHLLEETK